MPEKKMAESLGAPTNRADSILNEVKKTLGPRLAKELPSSKSRIPAQDF